jgi:hypothetical protein
VSITDVLAVLLFVLALMLAAAIGIAVGLWSKERWPK